MPNSQIRPAPAKRLLHIDALRGLMLVMMAVDHIPSDLQTVTDHVFGYVSAAAGFVMLAGLMAGLVYSRHRTRHGVAANRHKIRARVRTIYLTHVTTYVAVFACTIAVTLIVGTPPDTAPPLMSEHPWAALIMSPTLLYQPGLLDVLPMYCLFLAALPLLLRALEQGRRRWVFALSASVWLLTNGLQSQTPYISGWINLGAFNLGAWQFVFIVGVIFGHAWARDEKILPAPRAWFILALLPPAACLWAIRHGYAPVPWNTAEFIWLTNKNNVAPLRLFDATLIGYFLYVSLQRFPHILHIPPLALLGRHSLQVFAVHVVVAQCILFFYDQAAATATSRWICTALILAAMFLTAWIREGWLQRSSRRVATNSPLASAKARSIV